MSILEILAGIMLLFTMAYCGHMAKKYDEALMELKRASCRMRQLEEEVEESKEIQKDDKFELFLEP